MAYVVILNNNKTVIAVQKNWILNPNLHQESLIFYSSNAMDKPDFTLQVKYHFQSEAPHCYYDRLLERFGKLQLYLHQ